jgi:type IV pilus assembly protein PilE
MRRLPGFTLIELMITLAVIAILSTVAYPSYQEHVRRGIRSQGQQFLMDLAQREEQYFLDQRAYATGGTALTSLNMTVPTDVAAKYQNPVFTAVAGPPAGFVISLVPTGMMAADGTLIINNSQQRWREVDGNSAFGATDCRWEDSRCVPH